MSAAVEGLPPQEDGMAALRPRRKYSREELLALKDNPKCRSLPTGLDSDDLSDLQESCFFDKSPTIDGPPIYLGPQRGPGGAGARAPFGAARRPAGPPAPIHSRLIDEDERAGPYQRTASGQLSSAFASSSPSKPQAIQAQARTASGRYEDPAKMDRWDSRKLNAGGSERGDAAADGWQQQKGRGGDWRSGAAPAAPRGSLEASRPGSGWGGREAPGQGADLVRTGSSAPKDGSSAARWTRDDDDWRARKQSGALPEPRYDWSDSRAPAGGAPGTGGPSARGPPPGFSDHRERPPEWAEEEPSRRPRMTAADIEAERLRMQEQWKKQGGTAAGAAQASMNDIMTDDDIMSMMAEESEKQGQHAPAPRGAAAANGTAASSAAANAPKAGQHVDVAALLGGRPQPSSGAGAQAGGGSPAGGSPGAADRGGAESTRSRFANFFKLEESPAPGAAGSAGGAPDRQPTAAAADGAKPQQLSFDGPGGAPAGDGSAGAAKLAPPPGFAATTPADIERRLSPPAGQPQPPQPPAGGAGPGNAGQALLAMLKQQQAAQAAAAAGGAPRPALPPGAVAAADVSVLDEADKVARLTALQGLDEDLLGSPSKPQQRTAGTAGAPGGTAGMLGGAGAPHRPMQLPPGVGVPPPPSHHLPPGAQGPPPPAVQAFPPGQLPPGMLPPGMQGHLPLPPGPGGPFPPGQLPPGMHPPPPGMQYRPPAGMQYRPPGALPPQPGMQHPGMGPPPPLSPQQAQQQQSALLAQLLAAQANRGPAPPPQQHQHLPHVQPGQQINLAALLGAAGNPNVQLPPMPPQALNPAQLQGLRPPAGMMHPGMPAPAPGIPGFNPALLQQLQMQQQGLQRPHTHPAPQMLPQQPHPQQQLSSAQLMAALGMAQQGAMPHQGLR